MLGKVFLWSDDLPEVGVMFHDLRSYFSQQLIKLKSTHAVILEKLIWKMSLVKVQPVEFSFWHPIDV